ncbi:ferritin-like domain-containing protein [Trichloromonas sp.]|uniref:ferritin-like domain-containing protein n=1 Tax=Trichloromonas sp. TaxID=3069249 RepID=UPI002A427F4D|nr:ferritin-like domain-containing protein [Trichloromonas sp.]
MGTKGRAIIGLDVEELLKLLNKAFADEWLAYYQYWVGAKVAKGPMKDAIIAELLQHATEELGHANLVADRIIQLGGTPLTTPKVWFDWSNCGYDPPDDPFVRTLLQQNIQAEQCAIGVYDQMMKLTEGKDPLTYNMALTILTQEVEHEEDLQALLEDLDLMMPAPR